MSRFNPYEENGGSILAIAGQDFSVIAGDTRTSSAVLAVNGFAADGKNFVKRVKQRLERRMFPFYVYNILAGIEEDGTGAVYSFDPVGSYEREACRGAGAAQSLLQPFLDNQIYFKNQTLAPGAEPFVPGRLPLSTVLSLVVDAFSSATERHIEVGDGLEMYVVMAPGRSADDLTAAEAQQAKEWPSELTVEEMDSLGDEQEEGKAFRVFRLRRPLKRD
ncbi:hypothetical protein QFC22_000833 [Naganishia vaughanmartiniae]|uniref:Uncharacterized protein n=1 Tax=Naganishia vaughanmartiniae TaxID=1424756 RepID=A0ACC2XKA1_9TREE|nr:hypothetical protein QFC22_000833 [Naganishia vaughanmartiniae]